MCRQSMENQVCVSLHLHIQTCQRCKVTNLENFTKKNFKNPGDSVKIQEILDNNKLKEQPFNKAFPLQITLMQDKKWLLSALRVMNIANY